jgi:hypothetical protein
MIAGGWSAGDRYKTLDPKLLETARKYLTEGWKNPDNTQSKLKEQSVTPSVVANGARH